MEINNEWMYTNIIPDSNQKQRNISEKQRNNREITRNLRKSGEPGQPEGLDQWHT